jgi:predicted HNH restriction endonuclease
MFAKTEPESRDLELFSILGTEYSGISPQLASYYAAYFSDDLKAVVKDNQQVISLFQNYQDQINQLKANISQDEVKAANDYATSVSWANAGNKYEDTAYYNLYKQDYNAVITVITRYNQLVDNYNTLVTAYSGGQPISQIQSTTKSPLK